MYRWGRLDGALHGVVGVRQGEGARCCVLRAANQLNIIYDLSICSVQYSRYTQTMVGIYATGGIVYDRTEEWMDGKTFFKFQLC